MVKQLLWVAFGGAIGSAARFLVQRLLTLHNLSSFPWGTFSVNVTGCFLIGVLWALSLKNNVMNESIRLFLMTGICGGFTTFSAFSLESIILLRDQKLSLFLIYSFGSLLLGFLATYSAFRMFRP